MFINYMETSTFNSDFIPRGRLQFSHDNVSLELMNFKHNTNRRHGQWVSQKYLPRTAYVTIETTVVDVAERTVEKPPAPDGELYTADLLGDDDDEIHEKVTRLTVTPLEASSARKVVVLEKESGQIMKYGRYVVDTFPASELAPDGVVSNRSLEVKFKVTLQNSKDISKSKRKTQKNGKATFVVHK